MIDNMIKSIIKKVFGLIEPNECKVEFTSQMRLRTAIKLINDWFVQDSRNPKDVRVSTLLNELSEELD